MNTLLTDRRYVTDGGLETDLIFHHGVDLPDFAERIVGVRPNASSLTHAELDETEEIDEGDLGELTSSYERLKTQLPSLRIVGGCYGTDASHVAALWGVAI